MSKEKKIAIAGIALAVVGFLMSCVWVARTNTLANEYQERIEEQELLIEKYGERISELERQIKKKSRNRHLKVAVSEQWLL